MTAHKEGDTTVVDTDEARAGKTGVGLRYVLAISLLYRHWRHVCRAAAVDDGAVAVFLNIVAEPRRAR